jgi:hypothetical protein
VQKCKKIRLGNLKVQKCKSAKVQKCKSAKKLVLKNSKVQKCKSAKVQKLNKNKNLIKFYKFIIIFLFVSIKNCIIFKKVIRYN